MQEWVNYISGPIVGALIGYCTNYLAVKMLFRPYKELKIGKLKVPFTPGIIPKRRDALAKSIGDAIENNLFTKDDLINSIMTKEVEDKLIGSIMMRLYSNDSLEDSINNLSLDIDTNSIKNKLAGKITDKVVKGILNIDITSKIVDLGMNYFNDKKSSLGMLSMFIKDDMVKRILFDIGNSIETKIETNGKELIYPYVSKEIDSISSKPLNELLSDESKEKIDIILRKIYKDIAKIILDSILKNIHISEMIEDRINGMDIKELENLLLSVMKKELNAIVNLGALLGFIIGIINIFI